MVSNRFAVANRVSARKGNRTQPGVLTLIFIHKSIERTAKRFNRTAQAFRPGKAPSKCALKGRPTGTVENEYLAIHIERPSHSDALSGRVPCAKNPGLEGLGYGL
jgi:hypothetical protein